MNSNPALHRCRSSFTVTVFRKGTTKQVVFLEAGKDFVDTLFSFLLLPVGTILHILSRGIQVKPNIGGIWGIFESVDPSILYVDKHNLLQSRPAVVGCNCGSDTRLQFQRDLEAAKLLPRPPPERLVLPLEYFNCTCRRCSNTLLSSEKGKRCEPCRSENYHGHFREGPFTAQMKDTRCVNEVDLSKGLVEDNIKFLVTDKLQVMPSSTLTIMSMLERMDDVESNDVSVDITQILQLLHSALSSNTCLNDVFALQKTEVRQ